MRRSIRYFFSVVKLNFILLSVSAIGSLILSGTNTYHVMIENGSTLTAVASILTLETGLAGLVLALEIKPATGWIGKLWHTFKNLAPAILILLMLITTNVLSNIDILGLVLDSKLLNIVQLIILGALIPLLALVTLHAAKDQYIRGKIDFEKKEKHLKTQEKFTPEERKAAIQEILESGGIVNVQNLSNKFRVKPGTIKKDYSEVVKQLKQDKDYGSF